MEELNEFRRALYGSEQHRELTLGKETVRLLNQYQFDRSLGAYCLIINGLVWDAEIIVRSVYETCAKVLFLTTSTDEAREQLAAEFWTDLGAIYDRKGSEKAGLAERLARQFNENDARIFRGLQNPRLFKTEAIENKRRRNEIEQKWSFSEIIKRLSRTSDHHVRIEGLDALSHMYGVMSHLAHASPKALDLMEDRATRGTDLLALEANHIRRMLSDLTSLGSFSLRFSHAAETGQVSSTDQLADILKRMHEAGSDIRAEFDASQDEFYEAPAFNNDTGSSTPPAPASHHSRSTDKPADARD